MTAPAAANHWATVTPTRDRHRSPDLACQARSADRPPAADPAQARTRLAEYARHLRLHIVPYLGASCLSAVTTPHVRAWRADRFGGPEVGRPQRRPGRT